MCIYTHAQTQAHNYIFEFIKPLCMCACVRHYMCINNVYMYIDTRRHTHTDIHLLNSCCSCVCAHVCFTTCIFKYVYKYKHARTQTQTKRLFEFMQLLLMFVCARCMYMMYYSCIYTCIDIFIYCIYIYNINVCVYIYKLMYLCIHTYTYTYIYIHP